MKYFLTVMFQITILAISFSQFNLGITKNINLFNKYAPETEEYIKDNNGRVSNSMFSVSLGYNLIKRKKFSIQTGFIFKNIKLIAEDKIKAYYTLNWNTGNFEMVLENRDLVFKSKSLGFSNNFSYNLFSGEKIKNEVGISNELYFWEHFRSHYYKSNTDVEVEGAPSQYGFSDFFFSSANLSLFYCFTFQQSEKFSLATKISLGTNLYSDWNQFKKYAWLGVGLELGFGKKPLFKKRSGSFD